MRKKNDLQPRRNRRASAWRRNPRGSGAAMLSDLAWREIGHSLGLSGRELQIVRATFDDRKEIAIAAELNIALRTVHTHIERLHRKLAVSDRVQLVLRVMHEFLSLTLCWQGKLPPICPWHAAGQCLQYDKTRGGHQPRRI